MKNIIVLLLALNSGLSQGAENIYRLIEPQSSAAIGCWINDYQHYEKIVGYSNLGHIFLFNPSNNDYAVFYPFRGAAKSYGAFSSIKEFEESVLLDPGFLEYVLKPEQVQNIRNQLGALEGDDIYIPQPYPFLGGDQSVNSFTKGELWIMLDIVSQLREDCV
ncbi:MAG: DUF1851 domain-containing protein [Oceanospirillaceae bacterium]|nr:DUF1851 domain-containing protein [Oceanospirillaceae bacterium]